ncbi:MAG: protein-methionine-sulfoxide reductase catalytic subunit MsrP [Bacteroidetes bacterium]|nr:protein-methionine-sulfoxide reductase catalytic subunit MsrP [Bacteroidota bacterium]
MLFKFKPEIPSSEITDEKLYNNRRQFLKVGAMATIGGSLLPSSVLAAGRAAFFKGPDDLTPYEVVTSYNNFYEFGTGKDEPKKNATRFKTDPWKVSVEGEVEKPQVWDLDELIDGLATQEKVYRHRCVEGWSMVVPWNGFPLKDLITRLKPTAKAKFVEFTTLHDSRRMPGQLSPVLQWPYVEALRLDEAMNPLTLMVTGVYGKKLPPQNGAPIRLIIPWKYGFKGGKSIVKIRFTEKQPRTTWNIAIPREYGFYANVNPKVDHPRWTQAKERRLGEFTRRDTLMFNGYTAEVEKLYAGMDLRKNY